MMPVEQVDTLHVFGLTDCGRQRDVNEDRCHVDAARGLLIVVDGVGGHLAGGKAADVGLATLREHLEHKPCVTAGDIRAAITAANNEIHRLAAARREWKGMACVLTAASVRRGRAVVGHVGDTRLYKIHKGRIEKVTRDHSPVGELEDARRLTEAQAMHHPRRNEVYRDVGSDLHNGDDADFIDVIEIPFEPDAALLLCSDGLTDLVPSHSIAAAIAANAGRPESVVRALIDAANGEGGKDNVTVVYAEGPRFAGTLVGPLTLSPAASADDEDVITTRLSSKTAAAKAGPDPERSAGPIWLPLIAGALLVALAAFSVRGDLAVEGPLVSPPVAAVDVAYSPIVVKPGDSIMAALDRALPGDTVIVEAGEYREQLFLKSHVRLVSAQPRGATLRLPAEAAEGTAAVTAANVTGAELSGFRIVGDAATPLGTGLDVGSSSMAIVDVEITGATKFAVDFGPRSNASLVGSSVHDNPGLALAIRAGAEPRISNSTFAANGNAGRVQAPFLVTGDARPVLQGNVFVGTPASAFGALAADIRATVPRTNWFVPQSGRGRP